MKPPTNDQIAIVLGFAADTLTAFITEELIQQAYAKYQFHIGIAATAGFLLGFLVFIMFRSLKLATSKNQIKANLSNIFKVSRIVPTWEC